MIGDRSTDADSAFYKLKLDRVIEKAFTEASTPEAFTAAVHSAVAGMDVEFYPNFVHDRIYVFLYY